VETEVVWTIVGVIIIFSLLVITIPLYFTTSTGSPMEVKNVQVINVVAHQYYWEVDYNGMHYINVALIRENGTNYLLNATSADVTSNLYMIAGSWKVDFQVLPQVYSQYLLYGNIPPGFYAFVNSEYNGPMYNYDVGGFVLMPQGGLNYSEAMHYYLNYRNLDPLNPPVYMFNSSEVIISLQSHYRAMWEYKGYPSIPGPTFIVPMNSIVRITFSIPKGDEDLGDTSLLTRQVLSLNGDATVSIIDLESNKVIVQAPLRNLINYGELTLTFKVTSHVMEYGIVYPLYFNFNVGNPQDNPWIGVNKGYVTPLWGIIMAYS
jgi:Cu/Ag efflux protein CusF